jgi:hypothetical protein
MGQSGLTVGLALYEDLGVLRQMWAGVDDKKNARDTVATSVTFNEAWDVSTADLDVATAHGWPVARPDAYPQVFRKERGMSVRSYRIRLMRHPLQLREPGVAWWPGTIPAGVTTQEMASTMDLFVTAIELAGGDVPIDRPIDGYDLTPLLTGKEKSPRDTMFYYRGAKLFAVRHGERKAHFITEPAYGKDGPTEHDPPLLYHLGRDPGEKTGVAKDNPDVGSRPKEIAAKHREGMKPGEPQLEKRVPMEKK